MSGWYGSYAPSWRRAPMAPSPKPAAKAGKGLAAVPVWAWLALAAVAVLLYVRHSSAAAAAAAPVTQQGTTSGDDSAAQQPSGGGGSAASNLPDSLLSQPDPMTQQVQQTDTGDPSAPTMYTGPGAAALADSQPGGILGSGGTNNVGAGGQGNVQSPNDAQPPPFKAPPKGPVIS